MLIRLYAKRCASDKRINISTLNKNPLPFQQTTFTIQIIFVYLPVQTTGCYSYKNLNDWLLSIFRQIENIKYYNNEKNTYSWCRRTDRFRADP